MTASEIDGHSTWRRRGCLVDGYTARDTCLGKGEASPRNVDFEFRGDAR